MLWGVSCLEEKNNMDILIDSELLEEWRYILQNFLDYEGQVPHHDFEKIVSDIDELIGEAN